MGLVDGVGRASATPQLSGVRGLVLGLALGETLGVLRGSVPASGSLRAGVATQLAAFTLEGGIRALVRGDLKGVCHPPGIMWHAYCRWAVGQGIEVEKLRHRWTNGTSDSWPDGWLAGVSALTERRGSAPATVSALGKVEPGTVRDPTNTSRGCHALLRTLPTAAMQMPNGESLATEFAADIAALTHGHPVTHQASVLATQVTTAALRTGSVIDAARTPFHRIDAPDNSDDLMRRFEETVAQAERQPRDTSRLARLAPGASADAALLGGLYAALSFPQRHETMSGLHFAARAPDGDSVAAVAGALLGAAHGIEAWPVGLLSRHELTWVLDTLARDLFAQLTVRPGGTGYGEAPDPYWWERYPGW